MVSLTWPYAHEQWDHEMPYENENVVEWEEVQLRFNSKYFTSTHSMTLDDKMKRIKQKLAEAERLLKKE
jgi:hypothetical protein